MDTIKECALKCFKNFRYGLITLAEYKKCLEQTADYYNYNGVLDYDTVLTWYNETL